MKKALVMVFILLLFCLAACSDDIPDTTTAQPTATATGKPEASAAENTTAPAASNATATPEAGTESAASSVDPQTLLVEAVSARGNYTDQNEYTVSYSYELPRLNADTPDAQSINADIDTVFGAAVREQQDGMKNGLSVSLISVNYYGEIWQNLLSVVVIGRWDWSFEDYRVYCYDAAAGCALDTAAMLKKMGISEQDFLAACKTRFRAFFEKLYDGIPEDQREGYGYNDALARVDSEDYVNMNLMAYPDANGDIVVIAPIVSLAGADYYYYPINLGLNKAS